MTNRTSADVKQTSINFVRTVPDSFFYSDLEQIKNYAIAFGDKHLEMAIGNTIKLGYILKRKDTTKETLIINHANKIKKALEGATIYGKKVDTTNLDEMIVAVLFRYGKYDEIEKELK